MNLAIHRTELVDLFCTLAKIKSPLMGIGDLMLYLATLVRDSLRYGFIFDDAGSKLPGFERGNMFVNIPATQGFERWPCKGVEAHIDTVAVPPDAEVRPVVDWEVIRSDKTTILGADDKAGVAAILHAIRMINLYRLPHGPIQVLFTVGEERSMYGVREMDYTLVEAKSIVCVDGLEGDVLWRGCAAKLKWKATFRGKEGHSAFPDKALNAIIIAANAIDRAWPLLGGLDGVVRGKNMEDTIWHNVAEFKSNLVAGCSFPSTNVIPGEVVVCGEMRSFDPGLMEKAFRDLNDCIKGATEVFSADLKHRGSVEFEIEKPYAPFVLPTDHDLVREVMVAMKQADISSAKSGLTPGATHANVFNMHGIPAVVLGAGCRNPHSVDEHVVISEMFDAAGVLVHYLTEPFAE